MGSSVAGKRQSNNPGLRLNYGKPVAGRKELVSVSISHSLQQAVFFEKKATSFDINQKT
jgi:hypothetical protein